jgi:hypothetical protein
VAPALPWRKASTELLRERLFVPAWCGVFALAIAVIVGADHVASLVAFGLAGFAGGAALRQLVLATRRQGWRGLVGRANGGMIVHLGVILIAVALAASNGYTHVGEFTLVQGQPIEFVASAIRNVMRVIDFLPPIYLLGISSILVTKKNQRLGDLAADSIVVRERRASLAPPRPSWGPTPGVPTAPVVAGGGMLEVSLLTADEIAAVRHYLERRPQLESHVRREIAQTMAERLRPKVGGAPEDLRGEAFLIAIVDAKLERVAPA